VGVLSQLVLGGRGQPVVAVRHKDQTNVTDALRAQEVAINFNFHRSDNWRPDVFNEFVDKTSKLRKDVRIEKGRPLANPPFGSWSCCYANATPFIIRDVLRGHDVVDFLKSKCLDRPLWPPNISIRFVVENRGDFSVKTHRFEVRHGHRFSVNQ